MKKYEMYKANLIKEGIIVENKIYGCRSATTFVENAIAIELQQHDEKTGEDYVVYQDLNTGKIYKPFKNYTDQGLFFIGAPLYEDQKYVFFNTIVEDMQNCLSKRDENYDVNKSYFVRSRKRKSNGK